jgi:hypothetical protein
MFKLKSDLWAIAAIIAVLSVAITIVQTHQTPVVLPAPEVNPANNSIGLSTYKSPGHSQLWIVEVNDHYRGLVLSGGCKDDTTKPYYAEPWFTKDTDANSKCFESRSDAILYVSGFSDKAFYEEEKEETPEADPVSL